MCRRGSPASSRRRSWCLKKKWWPRPRRSVRQRRPRPRPCRLQRAPLLRPRLDCHSRRSRTSGAPCCRMRSASRSSSTPRCRSATSGLPTRRASSSICPAPEPRRSWSIGRCASSRDADIVRQVRVGRHPNHTTRVVLDVAGVSSYSVYPLYNPYPAGHRLRSRTRADGRRRRGQTAPGTGGETRRAGTGPYAGRCSHTAAGNRASGARGDAPGTRGGARRTGSCTAGAGAFAARRTSPVGCQGAAVPDRAPAGHDVDADDAVDVVATCDGALRAPRDRQQRARDQPERRRGCPAARGRDDAAGQASRSGAAAPAAAGAKAEATKAGSSRASGEAAAPAAVAPKPPADLPSRNLNGGLSIARQLGLGVSRIVIDPGHGGHDPGATGKGVTEAELVLDVALRLEKLLQKAAGRRGDPDAAHRRVHPAAGTDGDREPRRRRSVPLDSRQRQRQRAGARRRNLLPELRATT